MDMNDHIPTALIYARVSTKKQDPKSQLIRCEEYCNNKGYMVEKVFQDKFTGGGNFLDRPAMRELLEYTKRNIHKEYIVVFDDLKRFARDTKFHIELRTTFTANGLTPECLNYNFDDSPEGRFMETMFAAQNELERHQNRRQVIQKQRARLIAGYNAFIPPTGYRKVKKDPLHGTIDVPSDKAPALKTALKNFAYGEFKTRTDVARFLKQKGVLGKQAPIKYLETVKRILSNSYYAGYIEYEPWGVKRRKGHHKPLISSKEYNLIQSRLHKTDHHKPIRRDINPEFPLRGFINCYYCKNKLTACKSKGRWGGLYYKYYCRNKNCELRFKQGIKSVSRDDLHQQFKDLLDTFRPSSRMQFLAKTALIEILKEHRINAQREEKEKEKEKEKIENEIDALISLVASPTTSKVVKERYEKKIASLSEKITDINSNICNEAIFKKACRTPIENIFDMLENPYRIWASVDITQKQKLFYFLFEVNLEYEPEVGFRTPKKTLFIRLFEQFSTSGTEYVKIDTKNSNPLPYINYIISWNTHIRPMLENIDQ